jgi:hypothetical protein
MSKLTWVGLVVLMAGLVSGVLEKTFYGYVDENNVLRESFFLPMAFILVFLGGGLLVIAIARSVGVRWKKRA